MSEVFLLGHWKDYEELESSLSMPELIATLDAIGRVERRKQKFLAAIQGIDLDKDSDGVSEKEKVKSIEEIKARAVGRITGDQNLAGAIAEGFTPESGLEYKIMGGTEIG